MAVLKCKMCGGDLHFEEGASTCECEYCGNTNTLPIVTSDQEMNLFNRANHFRMVNEFDKAINAYEKILDTDDTNAEAHWGIVLSRFGIEYVEDPSSHDRIPTCHRVQMTSILSDPDYLSAVEHADFIAAAEYKAQAERIAQIQKGILAISSQEKPYDVFICYKESDDNGNRTVDSTLAQDIYYGLTEAGYRVFFSRITLEDKLGQEYEPYIFAALKSAKVMVVVGTKPEYFNAVWVKNEWSRYLDLMKEDRHRLLIPCYRDMDPYDLPDELSMLQSQDMGKIGFMQDLLRGIKKVLAKDAGKPAAQETVVVQQTASGTSVNAQVKRGNMALEDHDWAKADDFFEEALNLDPECAEAYLGKLLAQKHQVNWTSLIKAMESQYADSYSEKLQACPKEEKHIEEIVRKYSLKYYVSEDEVRKLYDYDRSYSSTLSCRKEQKTEQEKEISEEKLLNRAKQYAKGETKHQIDDGLACLTAVHEKRIKSAEEKDNNNIARIKAGYAAHIEEMDKKAEQLYIEGQAKQEQNYQDNVNLMKSAGDLFAFEKARNALQTMNGYKDSEELAEKCQKEIDRIKDEEVREWERKVEIKRKEAERAAKKRKTIIAAIAGIVAVGIASAVLYVKVIAPNIKYKTAITLLENGKYEEALEQFEALGEYKDSIAQIDACNYAAAEDLMDNGDYQGAIDIFLTLGGYKDSVSRVETCRTALKEEKYSKALGLMENGKYTEAIAIFEEVKEYKESASNILNCQRELLKVSEEGDTVFFGAYEQDYHDSSSKENIEWVVLKKEETRELLVSKYVLDYKPFNDDGKAFAWEGSSLRKWLNGSFIDDAFSKTEKDMIVTANVKADTNPKFKQEPGNDTNDKVFLLSIQEAEEYFASNEDRQCKPTPYVETSKTSNNFSDGNSWWWLRVSGFDNERVVCVSHSGRIDYVGNNSFEKSGGVRPALWINLDS